MPDSSPDGEAIPQSRLGEPLAGEEAAAEQPESQECGGEPATRVVGHAVVLVWTVRSGCNCAGDYTVSR